MSDSDSDSSGALLALLAATTVGGLGRTPVSYGPPGRHVKARANAAGRKKQSKKKQKRKSAKKARKGKKR